MNPLSSEPLTQPWLIPLFALCGLCFLSVVVAGMIVAATAMNRLLYGETVVQASAPPLVMRKEVQPPWRETAVASPAERALWR